MEDFYFAYGYSKGKVDRLYRRIDGSFERYDFDTKTWVDAPEQSCIYIGEDLMYDEISEDDANKVINTK
ncbi:hypothetical protein CS063_01490 [Sporanaerobium hydrogeniformans]|uniref:Uncharacterized protein n=1 Tax=Sporanaerobium hydrogeniformans TaxID=3072179 RepID=A0AC61DH55_9FIRM|nr:hypothetical protein [Sporanaerobium hydrogeniformans]PHV72175.1 hypothetical protein CS063_01490 [Sporanaerobium hydrogeniformans]